jgi:two-component system chemotaxis response regulator CheB
MIRLLIVEDSVTQREILRRLLVGDGQFCIVGEARNGREAVALVESTRPDVVLMDIHMPDMNGVEATREIMRRHPVPIVVASATLQKNDVDLGLEAMNAGAVSVIAKPEGAVLLHLGKIEPQLRAELAAAAEAQVERIRGPARKLPPLRAAGRDRLQIPAVDVIGLCASTGGPPILMKILSELPKPFPVPILLVQHISQGFEEGFARWLEDSTGHPTRMIVGSTRLVPGLWLAPGGNHLVLGPRGRMELAARSGEIHCPSGDRLFESMAANAGVRGLGVLLTGMGNDGAKGLKALKASGGTTVIQSESSCLIWGMPKEAKAVDAHTYELPPEEISRVLMEAGRNAELR